MTNRQPWWKEPTRKQWAAFSAAWVGWVLDAFDFTIYIVVASHMIKEFGVSPTAIGGSITLTLLVRLAGGFFAGWLADRYGRKLPLMMSLVWFAIFAAVIAYFVVPALGWRAMFLIAAVPALLVIPIRMFVPDELSHATKHEASNGAIKDLLAPGVFRMIVLGSLVMALGFIV